MPETKKKTLVVGLGASGISACRFLSRRGHTVVGVDADDNENLRQRTGELASSGIEILLGTSDFPRDVGRVVVSPGVPLEKLEPFREEKIPVIGELELGCREIQVPIIAVTGTNGKSTVVTNLESGLNSSGKRARALGNLGTPITEWVDRGEEVDVLVLEVSSYQLETIDTFCPSVAVNLNIAIDHLSRHKTMEAYLAAKARISQNQTIDDVLLLHKDLSEYSELQKTRGRLYWYGRDLPPFRDGLSLGGDTLTWRGEGPEWTGKVSLAGLFHHEVDNLLATTAALLLVGIPPEQAIRVFENPIRLPHRLEVVATVRGVEYINDSKATNTHSTLAALRSIAERRRGKDSPGKTLWLVGGEAKGEEPATLVEPARDAAVGLAICFGRDRNLFAKGLEPGIPVQVQTSMEDAFRLAADRSNPGDLVVLSPAGASFDEFSCFEERGDRFREWVRSLEERIS